MTVLTPDTSDSQLQVHPIDVLYQYIACDNMESLLTNFRRSGRGHPDFGSRVVFRAELNDDRVETTSVTCVMNA